MRVYCPDAAEVEKMVADNGINLFRDSAFERQQCCEARKTKPLRRAQVGLDAWICGRRAGRRPRRRPRSSRRSGTPAPASSGSTRWRTWDDERVWDYVRAHDVPYNPLHDQGCRDASTARPARSAVTSRRLPSIRPPEVTR